MKNFPILLALLVPMMSHALPGWTQTQQRNPAFEFGLGGAAMNYTRTYVSDFSLKPDGSYVFDLKSKQVYGGVNTYMAYGLLEWMYLDLQGTLGMARYDERGVEKQGLSLMFGPGIQFRPFRHSEWIQPFARVGINYFSKNFKTSYFGLFEHDPTKQANWKTEDAWNKGQTADVNQTVPLSFGGGVIGWMGNRVGLRLQAEYLLPLSDEGVRFSQATAGLVFRFGGSDKRKSLADRYIDTHLSDYADRFPVRERIIEKRVEIPVEKIVEKEIRIEVPTEKTLAEMMENVNFDFDKATLTPASQQILDEVARSLKRFPDTRFLVAGYTDAVGTAAYNEELSLRRAQAVFDALLERGVDRSILLFKGFGERTAMASEDAPDEVRRGDRKVVLERITSVELWNYLNR
jgi:outer membrane protein OmpA-like peptidoglycan-associated protein